MKQISSAITGLPKPGQQPSSSTGLQRGGHGFATPSNGERSAEMLPAIMQQDPHVTTDAVLSRLRQFGVNMTIKTVSTFPVDQTGKMSWREKVTGAEVMLASSANVQAAREVLAESMAPAPARKIEHWIGEVSAITARRSETAEEAEIALSAYTARLRKYPGDIVRDTLLAWSGKWFPSWGELKEILDERTAPRAAYQVALSVHSAVNTEKDVVALKRELAQLEDGNLPREWRLLDRSEQHERVDARILELKTELAALAPAAQGD
jgi:hypothetical protein